VKPKAFFISVQRYDYVPVVLIFLPLSSVKAVREHSMRKVIRGYARDKDSNLILIGTIPVPNSKDKRTPVARREKRVLVRQGATIFKKETIR
jgi:hypothetical protein